MNNINTNNSGMNQTNNRLYISLPNNCILSVHLMSTNDSQLQLLIEYPSQPSCENLFNIQKVNYNFEEEHFYHFLDDDNFNANEAYECKLLAYKFSKEHEMSLEKENSFNFLYNDILNSDEYKPLDSKIEKEIQNKEIAKLIEILESIEKCDSEKNLNDLNSALIKKYKEIINFCDIKSIKFKINKKALSIIKDNYIFNKSVNIDNITQSINELGEDILNEYEIDNKIFKKYDKFTFDILSFPKREAIENLFNLIIISQVFECKVTGLIEDFKPEFI